MRELTYAQALNEALHEEMGRDESVWVLGEDIAAGRGGIFGVTRGLLDRFGAERVRNTPLSEEIIEFADGSVRPAKSFLASLGNAAKGSELGDIPVDSLKFFCTGDASVKTFQGRIERLLDMNLPAVQRRLLTDTQDALEELLPYIEQLGDVLRQRGGTLCNVSPPIG